jgi:hypothetical protein
MNAGIALMRDGTSDRLRLLLRLVLGAGIIAIGTAVGIGSRDLGLLLVGSALFLVCFIFWRPAVYGVFVLVIVEGFFRNYFDSPAVLLVKDLMLAAIYLRVMGQRFLRKPLLSGARVDHALLAFAVIVLVQALNPNLPSLVVAAVGIRTWLFYIPLYYVALEMIQTESDLKRFLQFILVGAVPLSLVALYQAWQGPAAYASLGPAFATSLFVTGSAEGVLFYRPNATFAWSSHFAIYLAFCTFVCFGRLLGAQNRRAIGYGLLLGFLLYTSLVEGQRLLYVLTPVTFLLALVLRRQFRAGALVAGGGAAVLVLAAILAPLGSSYRIFNLLGPDLSDFAVRLNTVVSTLVSALSQSPIGLGTGATSIGSRYVNGNIPLFVENPFAKVSGDLSAIGLFVFLWLFGSLLVDALLTHRALDRRGASELASLAAALMAYELIILFVGYDVAAAAIPFWFTVGLVHALGRLRPSSGPAGSRA